VPDLPRGTVTFVFTDIEESTELLKRLGDEYHEVLSAHRLMVRAAFSAFDGIEIDTQGDAFFFVFPRARDAVAAAVEAQRVHAASRWPGAETVRVRMGLHTGEPALHDEGYVGLDVVRAARICTEGQGGQILVSETTRSLVGSGLPEGVSVFPLGQRHLRGIDEPERVYEVAIDGLELGEAREPTVEPAAPPVPEPPQPTAAPGAPEGLERDIERRFDDLGARLSAAIQEGVLRNLEKKVEQVEGRRSSIEAEDVMAEGESGVDDIADRLASLGDEIDARVKAALAKKGIHPDDS
jgi:class 3 adenylate cyclase